MNTEERKQRLHITVTGRVQGVGFRPFVYRIATEHGISGRVGNDASGVFIEAEAPAGQLDAFLTALKTEAPPLATITRISTEARPTRGDAVFTIDKSSAGGDRRVEVSPDVATCPDCLRETRDRQDRRCGYAFTNCTNCGPRYSIILDIPYDRPKTTMREFPMCPACMKEYEDPLNRRFHAQPNACPVCGPELHVCDNLGNTVPGKALEVTVGALRDGTIVAIKGLGGYHIACRADADAAVQLLRSRKGRSAKPFALMVADINEAEKLIHLSDAAREAMLHWSRPIVIARRKEGGGISSAVAPDTGDLGIMLPYTPLHHLLFDAGSGPLVMTSGNPSAEPLSSGNREALQRLGGIADLFLMHNRPIARPIDDSVVQSTGSRITPIRRARGFVPQPLQLPISGNQTILGVGGELKSTVCFLQGHQAVISEHLGELSNPAAFRNYLAAIERLQRLLDCTPELVAYDLHPDYASHRQARNLGIEAVGVQHHEAHIASCMLENNWTEPVIGIACDGTGFGRDGTIWGCELFTGDLKKFNRAAHLRTFPLPGGDAAAQQTWRPALGLLHEALESEGESVALGRLAGEAREAAGIVFPILSTPRIVRTSSLGRMFDAVSWLLGICGENRYEAEAAIRLEHASRGRSGETDLELPVTEKGDVLELDHRPLIRGLLEKQDAGVSAEALSAAFHETVCRSLVQAATVLRRKTGIDTVALSGGCFLNRRLLERLNELLLEEGFTVLQHRTVPPGDGGISLGQAGIAAAQSK